MVLENFIVDAPIVWDRVGKKIFENPHVKQGRKMRVQITNAGMIEDLSGYTLALGWKHTVSGVDGLDVFEDRSEANVGIFEMAYTENLMTNLGNLKASLVLTSVEDMVVAESNDFYVKVDDSPFGADAERGVGSYTRLAQILLNEETRIAAEVARVSAEETRIAAEVARVSAEETRVTDFNALVDSEIIAQNVATKLQAKEAEYLPRLVSNEQQLADTLNKSAITLTHMFADATARDAYFVAHPTELVELQFIKVGTGYQQYIEGAWQSSTAIVSEQLSATNQPIVDTGNYFATDNTNAALQELGAHKASAENPHGVTKAQVGLGNVDNTSDANKPVSTAQQTALNLKASKTQEAWITPTLLNGWVQHTAFENVGYMKDDMGFVHLRGGVSSGTIGTLLLILPSGYRQVGNKLTYHRIASSNGITEVEINHSTGALRLTKDAGTWYDLNAITFKV